MRILVLWASPDHPNLGIQALAEGTRNLAHRCWPNAEIVFQGTGGAQPEGYPIGNSTPLLKAWAARDSDLLDWIRSFDLVLDTRAGDSFADIYGLKGLVKMSLISEMMHLSKVPVVFGPQTLGPFNTRVGRLIGRHAMHQSRLVISRDSRSTAYAEGLGCRVDVTATDVVFGLDRPTVDKTRDVILNVSGLLWFDDAHGDREAYRAATLKLLQRLEADGRTVSILGHVHSPGDKDDDWKAAADLALQNDHEVLLPGTVHEARDFLGSAHVVIGARMHACLNALSMGTPAIPLAYSRKFAGLLGDLGWDWTVPAHAPDAVAQVMRFTRVDAADQLQRALSQADDLLDKAAEALQRI